MKKIRQTELAVAGLTRKCETNPFRFPVVPVHDQIVSFGLTMEIAIDHSRAQKAIPGSFHLQTFKVRIDLLLEQTSVRLFGHLPFSHLPLTANQGNLVHKTEYFIQGHILDQLRAPEWRNGN